MKKLIPQETRARTMSNLTVVCAGILLAAAILYFDRIWKGVSRVAGAASPLLIGLGITFLLLPPVNWLDRQFNRLFSRRKPHPKLSRVLATALAVLLLLALITGFFAILVPQLVNSIKMVVPRIVSGIQEESEFINELLLKYNFLTVEGEQLVISWDNIVAQVLNYRNVLLESIMAVSGSIYTMVFQFLMGLIAAIYLLLDKERFCGIVKKACYALFKPETCTTLIYWTRRANTIFAGFISGKVLDSLIIGVICYVGLLLMRIEYPMLISVIVGLTNIIPFFGPYIGAIPSILILLIINPMSALWFTIFIVVLQQIDGNVIGPFILGDYVGLSAFWIMLSILVGGKLFGFLGMLLSVPVFALFYAIVRTLLDDRLKKKGLATGVDDYVHAPEVPPEESK